MLGDTFEYHEAVADILCSGGVLVKRLGGVLASSSTSAIRKILTGPFLPQSSSSLVLRLLFHLVVITNLYVSESSGISVDREANNSGQLTPLRCDQPQ